MFADDTKIFRVISSDDYKALQDLTGSTKTKHNHESLNLKYKALNVMGENII